MGIRMAVGKEEQTHEKLRADISSSGEGSVILYKNRPMVREDNIICYGNMEDKYILQLIIMTEKEYNGSKVPDKVVVQILNTDKSLPGSQRVVKQSMQDGFSNALELGVIWLERYLSGK